MDVWSGGPDLNRGPADYEMDAFCPSSFLPIHAPMPVFDHPPACREELRLSGCASAATPSRILTGTQFVFGPANKADAVCDHASIPLPAGNFKTLRMLATGLQGNQMSKTVTVTYTDGTVSEFTQNFSDWFTPQNFPGEVPAVVMAYRDIFDGSEDTRPFNLYGYTFHLKSGKTVQSLALPADRDVCTLAVTLSENN